MSSTSLNIHVKLSNTSQLTATKYNSAISSSLSSPNEQLLDFVNVEEPHITLYLTSFRTESLADIFAASRQAINSAAASCPSTSHLSMTGLYPAGSYAMTNVSLSRCLQTLSDAVVIALNPYLHPSAKTTIPNWVDNLPPEQKQAKIDMIHSFGSPNVFSSFSPHISTAVVNSSFSLDLESAIKSVSSSFVPFSQTLLEVGFGSVGDFGTVLRGKDMSPPVKMPIEAPLSCKNSTRLSDPCLESMRIEAPESFMLDFPTTDGLFTATCTRSLAPSWVDRVYNLALNGYYDDNYFFRVINSTTLKIVQFGTSGNPSDSERYNYNSSLLSNCGVIEPQPGEMEYRLDLSNTFGTLSMSTSFNPLINQTWNATAELFINTGNNTRLDSLIFVPFCVINDADMKNVVTKFDSVGELTELGGDGVSLNRYYQFGNSYIASNSNWRSMARSGKVSVRCEGGCPCYAKDSTGDSKISPDPFDFTFFVSLFFVCLFLCLTIKLRMHHRKHRQNKPGVTSVQFHKLENLIEN